MTKIWVMSDIHDDFSRPSLGNLMLPRDVEADVCVIAGDIAGRLSRMGRAWLESQHVGMPIVVVAGNHDIWSASLDNEIDKFRMRLQRDDIHILDGESIVLAGTRFVGGTLWTDYAAWLDSPQLGMMAARTNMNDFRYMRTAGGTARARPEDLLEIHQRHRAAIEDILLTPFDGPSVVVTHHAPSCRSLLQKAPASAVDAAYASNMDAYIERLAPDLWIHGHIHEERDYQIGRTRILTNPRGYRSAPSFSRVRGYTEMPNFDDRFVVEVGYRPEDTDEIDRILAEHAARNPSITEEDDSQGYRR